MEAFSDLPTDYLAAVGALTISWAAVEAALDFCCDIIFFEFRAAEAKSPARPRNMTAKIAFLSDGLQNGRLASLRSQGAAVLTRIAEAKEQRDSIVHSAIIGGFEDNEASILRIAYSKQGHTRTVLKLTAAEVERRSALATQLCEDIVKLTVALYNVARPHDRIDYPGT